MGGLRMLKCRSLNTRKLCAVAQQEQDSQSTTPSSSSEYHNIRPVAEFQQDYSDDVSSIHFGESVTAAPPVPVIPTSREKDPPRSAENELIDAPGLRFVRSDSYLNEHNKRKDCLSHSSPSTKPIDNTTQPSPVLSSLIFMSLVNNRPPLKASQVVYESIYRHVYSTLDTLEDVRTKSLPVDVDNGAFVDDDNVDDVCELVLHHLRHDHVEAAIDAYQSLLMSQRAKNHELTQLWSQLSVIHVLDKNPLKALRTAERALRAMTEKSQTTVSLLIQVAIMCCACDKLEESLQCFREALQLECQLVGYHHAIIPLLLNNMACVHALQKDYSAATACLKESLLLQRDTVGADLSGLQHMATTLVNLATVAAHQEDYDASSCYFEEGLLVFESTLPENDDLVKLCQHALKRVETFCASRMTRPFQPPPALVFGDADGIPMRTGTHPVDTLWLGPLGNKEWTIEARVRTCIVASFDTSIATLTTASSSSANVCSVPVDLDGDTVMDAELYLKGIYAQVLKHVECGEFDEAQDLLRSTLKSHRAKYGQVHHLVGTAMHNLGMVNLRAGRYKDALWTFQEAISIRMAALGVDHPDVSASMMKLGMIQIAEGDLDTAYVTLSQVLHTRQKVMGRNQPEVAKILNIVGYVQFEFGSLLAALKSMEEALEIQRNCSCEKDASETLANMGFLYAKGKDFTEATVVLQEAYNIQRRVLGESHPHTVITRDNLLRVRAESRTVVYKKVEAQVSTYCNSFESLDNPFHVASF